MSARVAKALPGSPPAETRRSRKRLAYPSPASQSSREPWNDAYLE
jgi:hypothetical protein